MSKNKPTTSKFLNSIKNKEHNKNNKSNKVETDRTYVTLMNSTPKILKRQPSFFVSRINKAKYTKDSNFCRI